MDKDILLFDLDGTLTDPREGITGALRYALAHFGIQEDAEALVRFIGPPLRETFEKSFGFSGDKAEEAVRQYRVYFADRGIFENQIYAGIEPLLAELSAAGKTLALATSKPAVYAQRILDHFGIERHFSFVAGSELDGRRSAKDELIRFALDNLGAATAGRALMIGDREHDILGANKTGVDSVGVLYGYGGRAELEAAGATHIAEDVRGLRALLLY